MPRYRSGPSPVLIIMIGALMVFGGYYVWTGFLSFLEDRGDITARVTRQAFATATAQSAPVQRLPTLYIPAAFAHTIYPGHVHPVATLPDVQRQC